MRGQNRTHHLALHPYAASVDDPQRLEPQPVRLAKVFLHDRLHIARRNAVQIENIRDGNANRSP